MIEINVLGKPCPVPVIEAKKALAEQNDGVVIIKVDNIVAVENLRKMANGYGYSFLYSEVSKNSYDVTISTDGKRPLSNEKNESNGTKKPEELYGLTVVISRNTMGAGAEELGKILLKGFIYSLTELTTPPKHVIFLNSGAYLTSADANTVDDLNTLEQKGTEILTCGTCVNYYGLQDKLAVGTITDMYGITERMAAALNIINI